MRVSSQSRETLHALGLTILATVLFSVLVLKMDGLRTVDSIDYAQIARNINHGNGFTTKEIYPLSLAFSENLSNHPSLKRAPLFPLLIAAVYLLFGVNHHAVYLASGLFYVLLVPLVYYFGAELFDENVGLLAGIVMAISGLWIEYALSGLSEPLFAFLLVLSLYLAYVRVNSAFVGVCLGLGYLTRYNALFLIPGFLVLIYIQYDNWKDAFAKLSIGFFITISPWFLRNYLLVGDPLFSLYKYELAMYTSSYPYDTLYRMFTPINLIEFVINHPIVMVQKALTNANVFYSELPRIFDSFLIPALALGGLLEFYCEKYRGLILGFVLMGLVQFVALSFIIPNTRLFVPFTPIVIIFASAFIYRQFDDSYTLGRQILAAALVIAILVPNGILLGSLFTQYPADVLAETDASEFAEAEDISYIQQQTNEETVIVSDAPWVVAWYADRPSIWLPAQYNSLKEHVPNAKYVYVSGYYLYFDETNAFRNDVQAEYLNNSAFRENYAPVKRFNSGGVLFRKQKSNTSRRALNTHHESNVYRSYY